MIRYNYSNYQKLSNSFVLGSEKFNQDSESLEHYFKLSDEFDPLRKPPELSNKKNYVLQYIVPILQEYARDFEAALEVDEREKSVLINFVAKFIIILDSNFDFKSILDYATSFTIQQENNEIKLELFFSAQ